MSRSKNGIACCPRCNRSVRTNENRYVLHNTGEHGDLCPMTNMHLPIIGDSPTAYLSRARLVANLAEEVQDADPSVIWDYLSALSANELQRLTMIALAAVPVDQTVEQMFSWVCELPSAKVVTA